MAQIATGLVRQFGVEGGYSNIQAFGPLTVFVQLKGPRRFTDRSAHDVLSKARDTVLVGPNWYVSQPGKVGSSDDVALLIQVQQEIGGELRTSI